MRLSFRVATTCVPNLASRELGGSSRRTADLLGSPVVHRLFVIPSVLAFFPIPSVLGRKFPTLMHRRNNHHLRRSRWGPASGGPANAAAPALSPTARDTRGRFAQIFCTAQWPLPVARREVRPGAGRSRPRRLHGHGARAKEYLGGGRGTSENPASSRSRAPNPASTSTRQLERE
jgi:hypothetical protein